MPSEFSDRNASFASTVGLSPDYAALLAPSHAPGELGWLAHYRVLQLVAEGGMGAVFRAEDTHLQRIVALKVIRPEFLAKSAARERFLREARACAALKNDHIVTIYQVGQDRDVPFLAMEFLQGQSLEDRLIQGEPLPWREAVRIGREVADGLAAAHAHGLIHRDVKPANIWLEAPSPQSLSPTRERDWGDGGRVKLLDFGLARAAGSRSDLTQTGNVVGTPEFMSPEQARGLELDARSDLFSLGVVLYALCSGQQPFQGSSVMAVLTALAVDTPRPLRELNADVPAALAELIERLLAKDPARRPASAQEVRVELEAIEAGTLAPSAHGPFAPTQIISAGLTDTVVQSRPSPKHAGRRLRTTGLIASCGMIGAVALVMAWFHFRPGDGAAPHPVAPSGPPIRIGVLHSRTGTMAISERPVIDAVLLAVEEINHQGGLLGRPIEPILADGQSDETVFARQAEKLIQDDGVCTIFGCWTSASRKAVVPVVERHDHLLFYPVQYEGMEQSPNVVCLGLVPNQQILQALSWLIGFENKRRWFLVGSDYVFPVTANAIIRDQAKKRNCEIVGESYLLLGSTEVTGVVRQITMTRPDVIINTINGDTNVAFFRALRGAGITAKDIPTLSLSISEQELNALGVPRDTVGDYVAANYFQSLDTRANPDFVRSFGQRYGKERVISSPMATAYAGVHLWAQAVKKAGRADARAIRDAIKGQQYDAPQGPVRIDPATLHAIQFARVGRIDETGRLKKVYESPEPVVPDPFPASRTPEEWLTFLENLHKGWGGRWSNPGQ